LAITAEALKIMTSPMKTRIVVTVNIQRSTLTRLAIRKSISPRRQADKEEFQPPILEG
jgi:hypothetical protein